MQNLKVEMGERKKEKNDDMEKGRPNPALTRNMSTRLTDG